VEVLVLGDFDIFHEALTFILGELTSIQVDSESKWTINLGYFNWLAVVKLWHTLDLNEFHVVTFLVGMALIFVNHDLCLLIIGNINNHEALGLLTISIIDWVLLTKISESIAKQTQSFGQNKANSLLMANLVGLNDVLDALEVLSVANNVVVDKISNLKRWLDVDLDI